MFKRSNPIIRTFLAVLLMASLSIGLLSGIVKAEEDSPASAVLYINGTKVEQRAMFKDNVWFLPVQQVVERMGDNFSWQLEPIFALISKDDKKIYVGTSMSVAKVNNMDAPLAVEVTDGNEVPAAINPFVEIEKEKKLLYVPVYFFENTLRYPVAIEKHGETHYVFVGRLPGAFVPEEEIIRFSDIEGHWGKDTITWAAKRGIANGYEDGTFRPNKEVTEAEFVTMLIRAFRPDVGAHDNSYYWFYRFAEEMNYPVKGKEYWGRYLRRSDAAVLLTATQGLVYENRSDAIRYLLANGLAGGTDPSNSKVTMKSFNPNAYLTRAEALQFIKHLVDNGRELHVRSNRYADPNLLPDIPAGVEYDLPFKPPARWIPPEIKSVATDDKQKNRNILERELGFINGFAYNPYDSLLLDLSVILVDGGKDNHIAEITFFAWYGDKTGEDPANKIPYVARELFKFYLPNDYHTLFTIMNDGLSGTRDISEYFDKPMLLDGREVKIEKFVEELSGRGSYTVTISKKGKSVN